MDDLNDETREAIARKLNRDVQSVPKGWRKMAKLLGEPKNMRAAYMMLDDARADAGYDRRVLAWSQRARGK